MACCLRVIPGSWEALEIRVWVSIKEARGGWGGRERISQKLVVWELLWLSVWPCVWGSCAGAMAACEAQAGICSALLLKELAALVLGICCSHWCALCYLPFVGQGLLPCAGVVCDFKFIVPNYQLAVSVQCIFLFNRFHKGHFKIKCSARVRFTWLQLSGVSFDCELRC